MLVTGDISKSEHCIPLIAIFFLEGNGEDLLLDRVGGHVPDFGDRRSEEEGHWDRVERDPSQYEETSVQGVFDDDVLDQGWENK